MVKFADFQCSQCDLSFKAEEDLNAHIGEVHSDPVLPTPEKERAQDQIAELLLTPISGQRKEEDTISSPLHTVHVCDLPEKSGGGDAAPPTLPLVCDLPHWNTGRRCGKTFSSEDYLKIHVHSSGLH